MISNAPEKSSKLSFLVTAGPTRERIDPVRFISNYSTGAFGYEIARQARRRGARVTLISGPTNLKVPRGVKFIRVESARDMRRAVLKEIGQANCLIMAAAVCDWRVHLVSKRKIKHLRLKKTLSLVENPDILNEVLRRRQSGLILVGFALETENLQRNALIKLKKKNLDIIVANKLDSRSRPFGNRSVDVLVMDRHGNKEAFINKSKADLSKIILNKIGLT